MIKQNKCIKITYLVMLLVDYTKIPITHTLTTTLKHIIFTRLYSY